MAIFADPNLPKQAAAVIGLKVWAVLCEVADALGTAKGWNDVGLETEWMHTGGVTG